MQKTPPQNLIINHLYSPTIIVAGIAIGTPVIAQISFGLSIGAIAASPSAMISATCTQDWIEVNTSIDFSINRYFWIPTLLGIHLTFRVKFCGMSNHLFQELTVCRKVENFQY